MKKKNKLVIVPMKKTKIDTSFEKGEPLVDGMKSITKNNSIYIKRKS